MKVIVFGGSGFLGSYVADELTARGCDVTIYDRQKSPYLKSNQSMVIGDILDYEHVLGELQKGYKIVYNFAGLADINVAIKDPLRTVHLNIVGNTNILEACRQTNVKRFVYASSAYVFSSKGSFYGVSKQSSEKLIEEYKDQFGLDFTIIRYGSVYGDRADPQNRIYRIIEQAIKEKRVIFTGNGEEEREYIHVRDAASLSVDILDEKYTNQHLILTGIQKFKYSELLNMIKEIFNDEIEIEYLNQDYKGHYMITPYSFHPTIGRKIVNNPYIDFGQGLLEVISALHKKIEKDTETDDWLVE